MQCRFSVKRAKGALSRRAVGPAVIDIFQPQIEHLVELGKALALEAGQKLAAHGTKEALDFAPALRGVGFGVDQRNAQRRRRYAPAAGSGRPSRCPHRVFAAARGWTSACFKQST